MSGEQERRPGNHGSASETVPGKTIPEIVQGYADDCLIAAGIIVAAMLICIAADVLPAAAAVTLICVCVGIICLCLVVRIAMSKHIPKRKTGVSDEAEETSGPEKHELASQGDEQPAN